MPTSRLLAATLTFALAACTTATQPGTSSSQSSLSSARSSAMSVQASAATASSAETVDVIVTLGELTVTGDMPWEWGAAIEPRLTEAGDIAEGSQKGRSMNMPYIDDGMRSKGALIEDYPHARRDTFGMGVPHVAVSIYPDTFGDDEPESYQAMTGTEKKAIIEPLLKIYGERAIGGVPVAKNDPAVPGDLRGAWWGNRGSYADRLAPRYIENDAGDLRGVMYFINEGQDWNFSPAVMIVLIKPEAHAIVTAYLPLVDLPELAPFADYSAADITLDDVLKMQLAGYAYLNNPANYAKTEVGDVVQKAEAFTRSISLR